MCGRRSALEGNGMEELGRAYEVEHVRTGRATEDTII